MQELSPTTITSTKNELLHGTQWRCTAQLEEGIDFHEMRFISPYQVEGWSKDQTQKRAEKMFTASYMLSGESLRIEQDQENFQAVWIQQKIIAFVDGKTMIFHPVI